MLNFPPCGIELALWDDTYSCDLDCLLPATAGRRSNFPRRTCGFRGSQTVTSPIVPRTAQLVPQAMSPGRNTRDGARSYACRSHRILFLHRIRKQTPRVTATAGESLAIERTGGAQIPMRSAISTQT